MAPPQMGKQEALKRFATNLTERARKGEIDPVSGRDEEIRQIVDILMRRRQNNPILTGEAGVGKTAVVEGFAMRLAKGDVPPPLTNVALHTLDIGLLQAGASMKGEFENRLRQVIDEVQASPTPIILFVDEAHTLIGAGGSAGHGRCRQPAEAGAGPRHAADDRRDHLGGIQEVHREGSRADQALPGREGGGAVRGEGHPHGPRCRLDRREASSRTGARRRARGRRAVVAPLHPGAAAARQSGELARHRVRARCHQPARRPGGARGLPPADRRSADRARDHRPRGRSGHPDRRPPHRSPGEARCQRAAARRARGTLDGGARARRQGAGAPGEAAPGESAGRGNWHEAREGRGGKSRFWTGTCARCTSRRCGGSSSGRACGSCIDGARACALVSRGAAAGAA